VEATGKLLIIIGGIFVALNWYYLLSTWITKKFSSLVLPLGGVLVCVGMALYPALRPFSFLGLVLDIGFWAILFVVPDTIRGALRTAPWQRVATLSGDWADTSFRLWLYRPDYFELRLTRTLPPSTFGCWCGSGSMGRWSEVDDTIMLISHVDSEATPSRATLTRQASGSLFTVVASTYSLSERPPIGTLFQTAE
jgi:hypothetical protein